MAAERASPDDGTELDQIRMFLIREGLDIPGDALRESAPHEVRSTIDSHGLRGQLVIASPPARRPDWVPFLEELSGVAVDYAGNRHLSAVLFLERGDRVFALTFGFGRHLLRPEALESDFGLRTAAGLVDPEAIASVDSRAFEATVLQVRRQSSRGTGTRAIGFDVGREMLRALAGQLLDETLGSRVTGSDSLGLTASLRADDLGPRLDKLYAAFADKRYQRSFRYLDRWRQLRATDSLRVELDELLLARLERRRQLLLAEADPGHFPAGGDTPLLTAPQIIDYNSSGFVTSVERDAAPHPFPNLDDYLTAVQRVPTIADLRRNHDLLLMAGEPFAVQEVWPLYNALTWEINHEGDTYVLMDGVWWQVDAEYRARIDDRLRDIPLASLALPEFDEIEDEADYNIRVAAELPAQRVVIDRQTARFVDEEGGVEPCDVFTAQKEFIHVKRMTGSAAMSHLFGQALVSGRLFAASSEFRAYLRSKLPASLPIASLVPDAKPSVGDYAIILGIVTRDPKPTQGDWEHVALALPFLARNFLSHVATEIEGLGYRFEMARIPAGKDVRPATSGPVLRLRDGVDPYPNRWASRPRRTRSRRSVAVASARPGEA